MIVFARRHPHKRKLHGNLCVGSTWEAGGDGLFAIRGLQKLFPFLSQLILPFKLHTTLSCFREVHQTNIMECNHKYELPVVLTTECSHGAPLSLGAVVNDIWRWTVLLLV